uniref:All-trans-retinol 13,14-reductase n=1 Tax=Sphenodon punctatus TaxID=8508 RepID=A0A8D0HCN5_SPHPU
MWLYLSLIVILLLLLYWGLCNRSSSPSPFSADSRRPPAPLVIDKDVRKKILKKGFSHDRVPENLDAIVIGSGYGGLAAAVLLSKAGKRVLVLEQHGKAGGCCHTFSEKGFEFDVGIHYVGQMQENSTLRIVVDQLTEGQLQWAKMASPFDVVFLGDHKSGKKYYLYSGEKEYVEGLKKQFPDEAAAIDKYVKLVQVILANLLWVKKLWLTFLIRTGLLARISIFFKMASRSLPEVLNELTTNADLRAMFSYIFPTYGMGEQNGVRKFGLVWFEIQVRKFGSV